MPASGGREHRRPPIDSPYSHVRSAASETFSSFPLLLRPRNSPKSYLMERNDPSQLPLQFASTLRNILTLEMRQG